MSRYTFGEQRECRYQYGDNDEFGQDNYGYQPQSRIYGKGMGYDEDYDCGCKPQKKESRNMRPDYYENEGFCHCHWCKKCEEKHDYCDRYEKHDCNKWNEKHDCNKYEKHDCNKYEKHDYCPCRKEDERNSGNNCCYKCNCCVSCKNRQNGCSSNRSIFPCIFGSRN